MIRREGTDDHDAVRRRQPYEVELEGISLVVCKDVFPPDVGTICRHMSRALCGYQPACALDLGCGTGFLALVMRRQGFGEVWALDIDPVAVKCTRENLDRNPRCKPIEVRQSDLFSSVPQGKMFDLIVFNQPYFPSVPDHYIGAARDGGRPLILRFLNQVQGHLNKGGVILMSSQTTSGPENDPRLIALELGHKVNVLVREDVGQISKFIYEIHHAR